MVLKRKKTARLIYEPKNKKYYVDKITNIKDTKPLSYIFALLIFGVSFIPKNYAISKYLENNVYHITVFIVVLALAFALLILANLKKRKKKVGVSNE